MAFSLRRRAALIAALLLPARSFADPAPSGLMYVEKEPIIESIGAALTEELTKNVGIFYLTIAELPQTLPIGLNFIPILPEGGVRTAGFAVTPCFAILKSPGSFWAAHGFRSTSTPPLYDPETVAAGGYLSNSVHFWVYRINLAISAGVAVSGATSDSNVHPVMYVISRNEGTEEKTKGYCRRKQLETLLTYRGAVPANHHGVGQGEIFYTIYRSE
jgi:hypothetical protein